MSFSKEQKIDMLEQFILNKKSVAGAARAIRSLWNNRHIRGLSWNNFNRFYENFKQHVSVEAPRKCTSTVRTPENVDRVRQTVEEASFSGVNTPHDELLQRLGSLTLQL
jgi:hypothetical protein